jgi:5-methyltetrahydrofolate--homocysteine methyltransferase
MSSIEDIKQAIVKGVSSEEIIILVEKAIGEGYDGIEIINKGLIAGIETIGMMWKQGEAFIPEVIHSAEIMRAGANAVKEKLVDQTESDVSVLGKVIIGTVKDDVHDVGKSLVSMMMEVFGFSVSDLGVNVAPEKFIESAKAQNAEMICMSALLTTTMPQIENTIQAIKKAGLEVKTLIGGAPVTQEYADSIGADGYAPDAISAVEKVKELLQIAK